MSASKSRKQAIMDALFVSGRAYAECKRIYNQLRLMKSKTGKASLKIVVNGKDREFPV
jgi:hypothetical protein